MSEYQKSASERGHFQMKGEHISSRSSQPYLGNVPPVVSPIMDGMKPAPIGDVNYPNQIQEFLSGAKSSGHKPPYECLTPTLLRRAALRMQLGMHYGKHNWKKGVRDKNFILDRLNHAMEHLMNAMQQIDNATEMGDDDLAAVVVNCMFAMEYQLYDIPSQTREIDPRD